MIGNWPKPDPRFERSDLFSDTYSSCLMRADHPLARAPLTREALSRRAAHLAPTPYSGARGGAIDTGLARAISRAAHRRHAALLRPRAADAAAIGSHLHDDASFRDPLCEHSAARGGQAPIPFPRIKCYQMWHPQPDRPSDLGWLRALMSEVSDGLVAQKARGEAGAVSCGAMDSRARCV